ncbi:hypothetical protein NIES3806_35050 [Microcystis aeruginosa NIES-3806]|uniref:hypothetical protein n=1 Tax=Microcystis aeruginosa TaxID=1126 RepID=UPI001306BFCF|nr:hypothetical protein [Microcystis aeruginosa]GCL56146.1 hypothetical protein NIES3806_35050 [Microcystis aeruginosa NIES-3806]
MANFSDIVVYTLGQLLEIMQEADNAQTEIDDLKEYLSNTSDQINADWSSLMQQAESLFDQAEFLNTNLQEQERITETVLNDIQLKLTDLQQQYQQDYEDTKNNLIIFGGTIEISQDGISETLASSSYFLEELINQTQEAEVEVETALDKVQNFFDKIIVDILNENVKNLEKNSDHLGEVIQQECLDAVQQSSNDLKLLLEEMGEELEDRMNRFEPLKQKSENSLSPLFDDCQSGLETLVNQVAVDGEDKQNQLDDSNHRLVTILNCLEDNYINTEGIITEVMGLLNQVLTIKK